METAKTVARSFAGGEIAGELKGRPDLQRYGTALQHCENWVPTPQGSIYRRQGTELALEIPHDSLNETRLLEFIFNASQAYVMILTPGKIHFAYDGALLTYNSNPVVVVTPYTAAQLDDLVITQSGDVVTFVHREHAVHELTRVSANEFTFESVTFEPKPIAPANVGLTAEGDPGSVPETLTYGATRVDPVTGEESLLSATVEVSHDLTIDGNKVKIDANATPIFVDKDTEYADTIRYYKKVNGLFGFIGQSANAPFYDINITPDLGNAPPNYMARFNEAGAYPGVVGHWHQRKLFATTDEQPSTVWMSRTGTENNFTFSAPTKATDAISYTLANRTISDIRHFVDMDELYLLTGGGLWRSRSTDQGIVAADTLEFKRIGTTGASKVEPVVIGASVLYVAERSQHVMTINGSEDGRADDLSLLAPHLFDGHKIVDSACILAPSPIAVFLRDDGVLLCLNYLPQEEILGWFRITFNRPVGSIAAIPEGDSDALYIASKINGHITLERMRFGAEPTQPNEIPYLDSTIYFDGKGNATGELTGLTLFAGMLVYVLLDDDDEPHIVRVGTDGKMQLPQPATKASIGTLVAARARLLPFIFEGEVDGALSIIKNVHRVTLMLHRSKGVSVGTDWQLSNTAFEDSAGLETEARLEVAERYEGLYSGMRELPIEDGWNTDGSLVLVSNKPQPARITTVIAEVSLGV